MAFKVFEKGSAPAPTVPTVTIQKRGMFSLNEAAFRLLSEPEAVQFLWDADQKLIGIQAVPVTSPNAYPTRPQGAAKAGQKRGIVLIAGSMFTKFIGLDTSSAQRWVPRFEEDMLVVDLKEPAQKVVSNRSRAKSASGDEEGSGS